MDKEPLEEEENVFIEHILNQINSNVLYRYYTKVKAKTKQWWKINEHGDQLLMNRKL